MSKVSVISSIALACISAAASTSSAVVVNGIKVNQRVFNDFPSSNLVVTNSNTNPGSVFITENGYTSSTRTSGANRHDALFSTDGGATAATFSEGQDFFQSMIINLADTNNSPRKESGLRVNAPVTGDALFIVNSDAGEIVAFGGGAPFYSFGNNAGGNGYTPGTSLYMAEQYIPAIHPGASDSTGQGTMQYWINRTAANGMGAGVQTSGPLAWSNLEGGPTNYSIGAYVQASINNTTNPNGDSVTVTFSSLQATVTPEPTTLAALSLGCLLLRRRK